MGFNLFSPPPRDSYIAELSYAFSAWHKYASLKGLGQWSDITIAGYIE
jgi:hypothetical protein